MQPHPHFAGLRQPLRRISRLLDGTVEGWCSVDGALLGHHGPSCHGGGRKRKAGSEAANRQRNLGMRCRFGPSCHGGGRKRKAGSEAANRQRIPRLPVTFWTAVASESATPLSASLPSSQSGVS